ncbi:MAG TPA: glycosyltransferase family 1 protein [Verrucomicrobiae bacterium]|nr:glycosyltransferase family 1 protein [Verrucomicrobiae bacterium]
MRIGFSTSVIQRGQTGIAQYVFSLLQALAMHRDHEFVLFVLERDLPLFEFASRRMTIVPVPERYRCPVADILWHQTELPRLVQTQQLDVVHVPSYRRMLWRSPCPRVATIHDLAAFHVSRKYDWKRMLYGRVVAARLARAQEELIAVSRNTAKDMKQFWNIPTERVTVIHHGLNLRRFSPRDEPPGGPQPFGIEQPFFLYVARLEHPGKNHVRLIHAFERFKMETRSPWQLALAGSDWHGADVIHETIAQSWACRDIHTLGFVSADALPRLYQAASVFVYPSLHEGFGFPPLEAMASGCPVLCSSRGALEEVVGNAAVTINPEDVDALKNEMVRLSTDEELRNRLTRAGLQWSKQFDWARAAEKTLAVYHRARLKNQKHRDSAPLPLPASIWRTQ